MPLQLHTRHLILYIKLLTISKHRYRPVKTNLSNGLMHMLGCDAIIKATQHVITAQHLTVSIQFGIDSLEFIQFHLPSHGSKLNKYSVVKRNPCYMYIVDTQNKKVRTMTSTSEE